MLDSYLRKVNPYSKAYKQMHEIMEEQELRHLENGTPIKEISMFFKRETSNDPRRYNIPKIGEIAVIFDGENGQPTVSDFMVHPKDTNSFVSSNLNTLSQNCDPMVYPLILTMLQFYSARLAFRPFNKDFSPLLYCGKLLHQYIVDAYVKVEANRINWIKSHQSELHVDQYKGLMDYVRSNSGSGAIGRVTIMPSTFQVNLISIKNN